MVQSTETHSNSSVQLLLPQVLKDGGFVDDYRVAWGGLPNLPERPYGEPVVTAAADGAAAGDSKPGTADEEAVDVFQVQVSACLRLLSPQISSISWDVLRAICSHLHSTAAVEQFILGVSACTSDWCCCRRLGSLVDICSSRRRFMHPHGGCGSVRCRGRHVLTIVSMDISFSPLRLILHTDR